MGNGKAVNASGFREGRTAFRPVTLFDTSRQRVGTAGEVEMPDQLPGGIYLSDREVTRIDRASSLVIHAGAEAFAESGWDQLELPDSVPVFLGTSAGGMALGEAFYRQAVENRAHRKGQFTRVEGYQSQVQAINLTRALGFSGPIRITANACASGANAIGQAFRHIKYGRAEKVVCGGYDALAQLVFAGFDSLQALTPTGIPKPFDRNRDGLAIGEGASIFCVESLESAENRGATILAEITGYGSATDVHHLTQPHPEGDAALATMTEACAESGIEPAQIDYINSHGTGTPKNDVAEGMAIHRLAGSDAQSISVSSTKAGIGHLLGGAGAVEASICLMAMEGNWLPPTASTTEPDEFCDKFDLVLQPREKTITTALTNSFGFGGANATVIFQQFES